MDNQYALILIMRISFGNRLYLRENFVASFGKMFRLRCGQICRNKFVHIFVACLRRAHFYKAGGKITRKEARQKARLAKGAAETLFTFLPNEIRINKNRARNRKLSLPRP